MTLKKNQLNNPGWHFHSEINMASFCRYMNVFTSRCKSMGETNARKLHNLSPIANL